jgi:hypothetical protein
MRCAKTLEAVKSENGSRKIKPFRRLKQTVHPPALEDSELGDCAFYIMIANAGQKLVDIFKLNLDQSVVNFVAPLRFW